MFISFNENKFRKAIEEKDFLALKVMAACAIRFDPTFEKNEAQTVLDILEAEFGDEIFEKYEPRKFEKTLPPSEWNRGYFSELTYWFEKNFARDRIPFIKEVGKAVYPKYIPEREVKSINPPVAPTRNKKLLTVGIIVTITLVVLALVLITSLKTQ